MSRVIIKAVVLTFLVCMGSSLFGAEYFGFNVCSLTVDQAKEQLKAVEADFEDDYGYKGYSNDLPIFEINYYDKFNKYGSLCEGWLLFDPNEKLYKIIAKWSDEGDTFKLLKDALDIFRHK
ncbi:MAG: hypothetical protein K6347_01695 [Campylobacterales bacterium]